MNSEHRMDAKHPGRKIVKLSSAAVSVLLFFSPVPLIADSYYLSRIDDAKAVYLTSDHFAVRGDGVADDSDAIQQAIDKVQETSSQGILFIPAGRYRLTKTIYIWPGIRLIGYGATRPVFYLGPQTPGFEQGPTYMVFFAGARPKAAQENGGTSGTPVPATPPDATPGTFYSAISNIDIEIGEGNEGAIGVRAHYAQHSFLEHMDFRIGSGLAGIRDGGNVARDLHFSGGRYGIWTIKPSPGWQFTILDASFDGQREAAIREHEAGLTLVRVQFKNAPAAVSIDDTYSDELWIKDARMENISGPALVVSNENGARTEINAENINCHNVPQFASYRESGKEIAGKGEIYAVKTFSHGLHYSDIGSVPAIRDVYDAAVLNSMPEPVKSDIPDPPPLDTWANVLDFGAKGDGVADDTQAIKSAIASKRTVYFPSGQYRVTDTILLKPDTVLVGLHPSVTRLLLADSTPAFQGLGGPKALLETSPNGTNIVTGIGLYTNGINPRAVAAMWMAGPDSLMNDVRILGGHGTVTPGAPTQQTSSTWQQIYNNTHTADPDLKRRWDGQYPSIWVTQGGGGTFVDIWTPSTFAQAGFYVSHTTTSGRVYELSSEHHVRNEVVLDHVSNWQIYALQTEEERGESGFAVPLEIRNSSDITVANLHMYRVVSSFQPFPYAIKLIESRNIHFRNVHCYSNSKVSFDSVIFDETHNFELRQREFAWLDYSGQTPAASAKPHSALLAPGAKVEKLADGFFNISGGAIDSSGNLYFVDSRAQTIYRWSPAEHHLSIVRDNPLDPAELAFDKAGDLLVISSAGNGTVYSFKPDSPDDRIEQLVAEPTKSRPGLTPILPVDIWRSGSDFFNAESAVKPYQYVSPDGTTFIPASEAFVSGRLYYGARLNDELRAFGMAPALAGRHFYLSNEEEEKTYIADVGTDGTFSNLKLFAERGGEALALDKQGNVYIGAGQVFVYDKSGRLIDTVNIPGRPLQLLFGGRDRKTLFILARGSLYSLQMSVSGR
jgi:sugar lactone lactonase YvrE